jgi:uncharacterized Zn finger protein
MSWYYEQFPRSKPKEVKGGIKAQSKRGFGESWWAKRWVAVIESFDVGGRLGRGRTYARKGQVLSIDVSSGKVQAEVQGSMPEPYEVTIEVTKLTSKEWTKVIEAINAQALFAAKLLAGEMPAEIEQLAQDAGVSLFPSKANDLQTDCSCPDWSNPCKHVAAVYYLLGETFDRDPFLLFRLRGMDRDALMKQLNQSAPSSPKSSKLSTSEESSSVPLSTDLKTFWSVGDPSRILFADLSTSPAAGGLPKRLGPIPFWRGREHFLDSMTTIYQASRQTGMNLCIGESMEERKEASSLPKRN